MHAAVGVPPAALAGDTPAQGAGLKTTNCVLNRAAPGMGEFPKRTEEQDRSVENQAPSLPTEGEAHCALLPASV
jgi:hypothetical protein